jgi:citrate lyase subunit beta/citryl-CoA lyase
MLLRSMLFTPGNNMRMIAKCGALGADAVILDLEDSVPVSDKETARLFVRDSLADAGAGGSAVFVRVNAAETGLDAEDLDLVVRPGLAGVVMPKAESAEGVAALAGSLDRLERERGMAAGSVWVVPIVESARGLLAAAAVAAASPRVVALALGGVDFSRDMGVELTAEGWELFHARAHLAVAARASGLAAVDSPCLAARDRKQLAAEAGRARGLGFRGKLLIHPAQVETVNAAFSPTDAEAAWAHKVVAAFEAAEKAGQGAIAIEGKMVDRANYRQARDLLALAEAAAGRDRPGAAGQG